MTLYSFEQFLTESLASEEAKKQGLTSAGYGLWRDKQGKIVARTVNDKLTPVSGSRADIRNYHSDVPKGKEVDHDAIDSVNSFMDKYSTPGTHVDTEVNKYSTHKTSAIHPDKAKHLHDDLVGAGFKYEKDEDFGQHIYRKGRITVGISGKPEIGHKPSSTSKDHHSVVVTIDHAKAVKGQKSSNKAPTKDEEVKVKTSKGDVKDVPEKDRKKVNTLLTELKEMTDEAKKKGESAPNYDLCKVQVPGTNLFCQVNKGIPRAKMPQLKGDAEPGSRAAKETPKGEEANAEKAFIESLKKKGVKLDPQQLDASTLKSTQSQLVGSKVAGMLDALKKDPKHKAITAPIFVSKDGYILDGHHRWAALVGLSMHKDKPVKMDTIVVDMNIKDLVKATNDFADEYGIKQKAAG